MSLDDLIEAMNAPGNVRLDLDQPVSADPVRGALFALHLARLRSSLTVNFPHGQATREISDSLDASLLGPLIWSTGARTNRSLADVSIITSSNGVVDRARRRLCLQTSAMNNRGREGYLADLAKALRSAGIQLPRSVVGPLASIGFELNSNAEEYGALDEQGREFSNARFFSIAIRSALSESEAPLARDYLREYGSTHITEGEWLELVVADAGVGIPYPSYFILAGDTARRSRDVYSVDPSEERQRLKLVLEDYCSTKGRFGRSLNTQTSIGEGTKIVRFQIAPVRGFVGLRTGRCLATWWHASPTLTLEERRHLPGFDVDQSAHSLFRGTVWQVLIPLQTQLRLV